MTRQPTLDIAPLLCAFAAHPTQRPHCQLTATVRYDTIALCTDCDTRRSTVGKAVTPTPLPAQPPIHVLTWIAVANEHTHHAQRELAAAVERARTQGHPWSAIAAILNITRQAAQQRFKPTRPSRR